MFKRLRLRKVVNNNVKSTLLLHVYPLVEVEEKIKEIFGQEIVDKLLARNFSQITQDPIVLTAIRKILQKRTTSFIEDILDLMEARKYDIL